MYISTYPASNITLKKTLYLTHNVEQFYLVLITLFTKELLVLSIPLPGNIMLSIRLPWNVVLSISLPGNMVVAYVLSGNMILNMLQPWNTVLSLHLFSISLPGNIVISIPLPGSMIPSILFTRDSYILKEKVSCADDTRMLIPPSGIQSLCMRLEVMWPLRIWRRRQRIVPRQIRQGRKYVDRVV